MSTMWIILNPSNFRSFLVLILAKVRLKDSSSNAFIKKFGQATIIIDLVALAKFFEATCTSIFKHILATRSTKSGLLRPF